MKESDGGNSLYTCRQCGFAYDKQEWAKRCEEWCLKHKSCNIDIIKHAVNKKNAGSKKD